MQARSARRREFRRTSSTQAAVRSSCTGGARHAGPIRLRRPESAGLWSRRSGFDSRRAHVSGTSAMPHAETLALEARWQRAWQQSDCFRAPMAPTGVKFFNYDSGPFTNGELHLGHVRTYVLGDVMARYQRSLGKCVLYATDFDAFGLPSELAAQASGASPFELTASVIDGMTQSLRALGISYDWSRVRRSCDPAYYRWTQWLFLELYRSGLIEYREAD